MAKKEEFKRPFKQMFWDDVKRSIGFTLKAPQNVMKRLSVGRENNKKTGSVELDLLVDEWRSHAYVSSHDHEWGRLN